MVTIKTKIPNLKNELMDVLIEGNNKINKTIIFVHGFATDKHETAHYFDDIAKSLVLKYRIIRFDLSGCGKSEGLLAEKNYQEWAKDLQSVIIYVKKNYPGDIYIFAQSMGCFITSLLNPTGIKKTIFTGIPNSNIKLIIDRILSRFGARKGAKIDFNNISFLPRSTGDIQKIGPSFWKVLKEINPIKLVSKLAKKTKLLIIHPKQDEIIGQEYLKEYSSILPTIVMRIDGDHSFKKLKDRKRLIKIIKNFYENN